MRNLLYLLLIGVIVYTIITLVLRARGGPAGGPRSGPRRRPPAGPVAPDDDPEFLWRLDQRQRQADRDAGSVEPTDGTDQNPGAAP